MKKNEINLAVKAANVITAIEDMNEQHSNLKETFDAAASAEEKDKLLDLKVIFATRAEDFVENAASLDDDLAGQLITLAELEATIMARAIGEIETRAFADENNRSQEISDAFATRNAQTLAKIHKPAHS